MRAYSRRRLQASARLGAASMTIWFLLRVAAGAPLNPGVFLLGFSIGFVVGVAELFVLRDWLRGAPFFLHIAAKSFAIVAIMYATFAVLNILDVVIDGKSWAEYFDVLLSREVMIGELQLFCVIVFLIFFVHIDRLLGPGVLLGYVTGRYHRPRRESRIFMFLDLKGSTTLAEGMEPERYYKFLHRYFTEMSEPILETDAEIYQYVGDEIVLSWPTKAGIEEASCVRLFFRIEDRIDERRDQFLSEFGVVPEFKAGIHAGEVITAQIGELKSEIVYNGDVLNTAARIQSLCNELGEKVLISANLAEQMNLSEEYEVRRLDPRTLRGKEEVTELWGISRKNH